MASAAPWRQMLMDSLEANKHLMNSKYFQLATVKQNGAPTVRTIVFRGFEDGNNKLLITTDARSRKIEEIKNWPLGECVVYFSETWEQFRISGLLDLIGPESPPQAQKTRKKLWDASSPRSLLQLVGPHPGTPLAKEESVQPHLDKEGGPVENFFIVTLDPTEVDYLHLQQGRRVYFEKKDNSEWTEQELNP
jgi:pyridoxamine 5'-phosphate oxidase